MADPQAQAFDNAVKAVNSNLTFPQYVFTSNTWGAYFFFEDMRIFDAAFVEAVRSLLEVERSQVACIINLDRLDKPSLRTRAAIYFERQSDGAAYEREMRGDLTPDSWLRNIERYVCTSEHYGWCIYCDRCSDFGAIALQRLGIPGIEKALALLGALPFEDAYELYFPKLPPTAGIRRFREQMARHYTNAS